MKTKVSIFCLVFAFLSAINLQLSTTFAQDGAWIPKVTMLDPVRVGPALGTVNGIIYSVGGQQGGGNSMLATVDAYDPVSNTWSNRASLSTARAHHAVAVVDGILYAIGGCSNNTCATVLNTVEAYDAASNTWTNRAPMPDSRRDHGVGVVNGIIYAVGGYSGGSYGSVLATVVAYDPASDIWTNKAPLPSPRANPAVAGINGILYVAGGSTVGTQVLAYNPASNTWTTNSPMPVAAASANMVAVVDGKLYCVNSADYPVLVYNPMTDTWTTNAPVPKPFVSAFGVGVVNGTIYIAGGASTNSTYTKATAAFTPASLTTLTNLVVTPTNPVIGAGTNRQFTATGYFDDGSSRSLTPTNGLVWSSSHPAVATINTNGVATGLSEGSTLISATASGISNSTTLMVVVVPTITTQPVSAAISPGGTAILSVSATGGNLSYQWQCNGTNIAGATSATLTITNFSPDDPGSYTVTVSNEAGSSTSKAATLATVDIKMFAGVIVNGPLGSNYVIEATTNLPGSWTMLTNVALPTQPYIFIDYASPTNTWQFYRVVPQ